MDRVHDKMQGSKICHACLLGGTEVFFRAYAIKMFKQELV